MDVVKAIVILSFDGKPIISKYFDDNINQKQMEKKLFAKTKTPKARNDVFVLDDKHLVVHKFVIDSHYYLIGKLQENPVILDEVIECLVEIISKISHSSNTNTVLDNINRVILVLDEIFADGIIYEIDSNKVLKRISASTNDDIKESTIQYAKRILFS